MSNIIENDDDDDDFEDVDIEIHVAKKKGDKRWMCLILLDDYFSPN